MKKMQVPKVKLKNLHLAVFDSWPKDLDWPDVPQQLIIKYGQELINLVDEDAETRVCGICSGPLAAAASGPDLRYLNIQGEPYSSIISSALGELDNWLNQWYGPGLIYPDPHNLMNTNPDPDRGQ